MLITFVTDYKCNTTMNERLLQFIKAENISQSQLADNIGVARAAVSHVLAGRNKPSYDFIEGLSRRYPALSIEWLISGTGPMYKKGVDNSVQNSSAPVFHDLFEGDLFSGGNSGQKQVQITEQTARNEPRPEPDNGPVKVIPSTDQRAPLSQSSSYEQRRISKILVFYSDGTFKELQ